MKKNIQQTSYDDADRRLDEILSRVKYTGPEPAPDIDELASDIANIIHDMRREKQREL